MRNIGGRSVEKYEGDEDMEMNEAAEILVRRMRGKGMKLIPLTNILLPQFWFLCVTVAQSSRKASEGMWGKEENVAGFKCRSSDLIRLNPT